jgi:hypothetical protein
MIMTVLSNTLRLARASWRGQLVVMGLATILLGVLTRGATSGAFLQVREVVVCAAAIALVTASARVATQPQLYVSRETLEREARALQELLPRAMAQAGIAALPSIVLVMLSQLLVHLNALFGLLVVPVAFAGEVVLAAPILLAVAAVVHGDRAWVPTAAFAATARAPLSLAGTVLCGSVAAGSACLPLIVVGLVLAAVLGPLSLIGAGLAAASMMPWMGAGALALWTTSGATISVTEDEDDDGAAHGTVAAAFGADPAAVAPAWVDGPSWQVTVQPGVAWGTWLRMAAPSAAAFRVAWSEGPAPSIALGSEAGAWVQPGELAANGAAVVAAMEAGNTYLRVDLRGALPQNVAITMLLPAAAAA